MADATFIELFRVAHSPIRPSSRLSSPRTLVALRSSPFAHTRRTIEVSASSSSSSLQVLFSSG